MARWPAQRSGVVTGRGNIPAGGTTGVTACNDGAAMDVAKVELLLLGTGYCMFTMVMCVDSNGFWDDVDFRVFPTL